MKTKKADILTAALAVACAFGASQADAQVEQAHPRGSRVDGRWMSHPVIDRSEFKEGHVRPHSWVRDSLASSAAAVQPQARSGPGGFWPIDMQTAYGINSISGLPTLAGGLTAGGAGITVAIVDAYDAPNVLADLNAFSTQFGLPKMNTAGTTPCSPAFTKVNQTGGPTVPAYDSGWEVEISLDVQWVHAIAPCANILLVEAKSSSSTNLLAALDYADSHAQVVSMSWGGGESRGESSRDQLFQSLNVVYIASSGDTGGIVEWPSVSKNVLAVGGTNLPVSSTTGGLGTGAETAWNGSGGGCTKAQEPEPSAETVIHYPVTCTGRGVPDVAASGGPNSAVAVYVSKQGGYFHVYGTSLACPMWAGIIAIADAQRKAAGKTTLTYTNLADLYSAYTNSYSSNFTDITSGRAGGNTAVIGWDFATGLGTPKTASLVPYLISAP